MAWQRAAELLEQREYEQVASLLREKQETVQLSGQMNLVILLAAACQLCLTCQQFRADRELHQLGLEKARRRERESRRQIQAVLTMLSQVISPVELAAGEADLDYDILQSPVDAQQPSVSEKPSTLLQKVKHLLGLEPTTTETAAGSPPASLDRPETGSLASIDQAPLAEQIEQLIALTIEEEEIREPGEESPDASISGGEPGDASVIAAAGTSAEEVEESGLGGDSLAPLAVEEEKRLEPSADQQATQQMAQLESDDEPEDTSPVEPPVAPRTIHSQTPDRLETTQSNEPSLVVYCLGPFRVYQHDRSLTDWTGLKSQSILKYLLAQKGKSVAKDVLMDVFWSDSEPEAARRNLHQAIYSLRQTLRLGDPDFQHILFEQDRYLLNPGIALWLDFEEFQKHVQAGWRLEAAGQPVEAMAEYGVAEGLYQGVFLEEDLYEDWCQWQREQIQDMYLDISNRLGEHYLQSREYTAAMVICQKVLAQDNCNEQAHFRLMHCYLAQHQRHLAVRQYQFCREALKAELGLEPSEEMTALYQDLTN